MKIDNNELECIRQQILGDRFSNPGSTIPTISLGMGEEYLKMQEAHLKEAEMELQKAKEALSLARLVEMLNASVVE